MSMDHIFAQVAAKNSVTPEEVYQDIESFIALASSSSDPAVRKAWAELQPDGAPISPEGLLLFLLHSLT